MRSIKSVRLYFESSDTVLWIHKEKFGLTRLELNIPVTNPPEPQPGQEPQTRQVISLILSPDEQDSLTRSLGVME